MFLYIPIAARRSPPAARSLRFTVPVRGVARSLKARAERKERSALIFHGDLVVIFPSGYHGDMMGQSQHIISFGFIGTCCSANISGIKWKYSGHIFRHGDVNGTYFCNQQDGTCIRGCLKIVCAIVYLQKII